MNNLLNFEGLVSDIDLLVGALFVDLVNMDLSLFHEHTTDIWHIPFFSLLLYLVGNVRIFWEYLLLKEVFREAISTNFADCHIDKLRLLIEANIIITYEWVLLQLNFNMVRLVLGQSLRHQIVTDSYLTFSDEVHICNFILFVKNEPVFWLNVKLAGDEAKTDLKKKLLIKYSFITFFGIISWNEEKSKSEYDIVKEIMK